MTWLANSFLACSYFILPLLSHVPFYLCWYIPSSAPIAVLFVLRLSYFQFLSVLAHFAADVCDVSSCFTNFAFPSHSSAYIAGRAWCIYSGNPRLQLVLVREFESRRGEILNIVAEIERINCRERLAWVSTVQCESKREARAEIFSRQLCKARTVVGRGEEKPAMLPRICVTTRREG